MTVMLVYTVHSFGEEAKEMSEKSLKQQGSELHELLFFEGRFPTLSPIIAPTLP